jgi:hypothetical protein
MTPSAAGTGLLTSVPTIDEVLSDHESELGHDFIAYRNHAYHVVNLCAAIVKDRVDLEKIAVAAVFHDLGIWTDKTFDYIAPSVALAREYLVAHGREAWIAEIEEMIEDHPLPRQSRLTRRAIPPSRLDRRDPRAENIRASTSVDPVGARWLAERRVSLAPGAVDSRKIPHAPADAVADDQTVIATGPGPDPPSGLAPTKRQASRASAIVTRSAVDAVNDEPTPGHFAQRIYLFAAPGAEAILLLRVQAATPGPADSNFHLRACLIL